MSQQRYERRARERKIRELKAEAAELRSRIDTIQQRKVAIESGASAEIEAFVDSMAMVADIDDQADTFKDDDALYEALVHWQWRGVQTVAEAKELLVNEVARRSVGKGDLALLLSSIDHTAMLLYRDMPESLKTHDDPDTFVDAAVARLTMDDFESQLLTDENWVKLRERWIHLGWRGATSKETFNAAFIREVSVRIADMRLRSGRMLDTILDRELAKVSQVTQKAFIEGFKKRLESEYGRLVKEDTETAFNRVLAEEVVPEHRAEVGRAVLDKLKREHVEKASVSAVAVEPNVGLIKAPLFGTTYSDHVLMRVGRLSWEDTYARGLTDERVLELARELESDQQSFVNGTIAMALFAAKWAVHAFQRLMTSHTFAAALMCSDVQREVLEGIEKQWDAFLVIVPNGVLVGGDGIDFSRIFVATYSFGAHMILLATNPNGIRTPWIEASSLSHLLAGDENELEFVDSVDNRCLVMAKRLVAGLLLNLQHPTNVKIRKVEARPKSKGREAEPEHRIVTVGKPLTIDCRASVKEYIEHGPKKGRKHSPPTVQVMVRGFYRNQPYGPRSSLRRSQWIEPFWRGPEAALIQTRAKVPG